MREIEFTQDQTLMKEIYPGPGEEKKNNDGNIMPENMLETIAATARKYLGGARGSHGWDHTARVFHLCRHIGSVEGADMKVVSIAAYLHDIGRGDQDTSNGEICHAEKGAEIAETLVDGLSLTGEQKKNIIHCIRTHRFRRDQVPETLEARVLFDADKLDAIGAVGVARAFLFAGEVGARLHSPEKKVETTRSYSEDDTGYREYKIKLCKIKDRMLTREGGKLAKERHAFMEVFFNRFLMEYEGKG